ncbi:conserved oligomeric Golgi complex subunit 1-like [Zingiber officinale]|uniref:conserved oligomeric Golgi complex subunit 1-like n=1 Tax=Zingiber officinale TaxID=94328 RepID=UPI001C4D670F|nr:conserved oligomeric Golgi complex subunit 1-like [Zingiber officinale]
MRSPPLPSAGGGARDADTLFRSKPIPEIRAAETTTRREIKAKEEELRLLVGESYRDLIDSADSILLIHTSSESIDSNLAAVEAALRSLSVSSAPDSPTVASNPARARVYSIAARVKYLIDTPENIWGCLDESMLLEASGRYLRANEVYGLLTNNADGELLAKFPLIRHQWEIVEGFKSQISQRSRERLIDQGLTVAAYADALAAAATIDDLDPKQVLGLFLDSRRSWISQKLVGGILDSNSSSSLLCDVVRTIRSSLGQVGELLLLALNEMPLFYKMVLGSPPGTQLFGAIPHPEDEVRLWKSHREKLEATMVLLEPDFIAGTCSSWLGDCCEEIFGSWASGKRITDAIASGEGLASAEKMVRYTLDDRDGLEESLEHWLKSVFGSDIETPWDQLRGLILKNGKDILEDRLEDAFTRRMKEIMDSEFANLNIDINLRNSIQAIVKTTYRNDSDDSQAYLRKLSIDGGIWFSEPIQKKTGLLYAHKPTIYENDFNSSLNAYLGPEVSRIRDALDRKYQTILEDLLCYVESHNSFLRLKELAPYLQEKCYSTIAVLLKELEDELALLTAALERDTEDRELPHAVLIDRSLFIGRLLFTLQNDSSHIPLILGSPRQWVKDSPGAVSVSFSSSPLPVKHKAFFDSPISPRHSNSSKSPRRQFLDNPRRQTISAAAALFALDETSNPKLEVLNKIFKDLRIKSHGLWIVWLCNELVLILSKDFVKDEALSSSTSLQGWEVTNIKQNDSKEGSLEMTISLPSMPSLYITSILFQACLEIHRIGGHILDRYTLQMFAWKLLQKVVEIYERFLLAMENGEFQVSDKGILQILLDLKFIADILSGGKDSAVSGSESNAKEDSPKVKTLKPALRWKQTQNKPDCANVAAITKLINSFTKRLDPIDWAMYEPYLWENEKQSYKRYSVLFGFLVQLNRMYTETVQKLPTKSNTGSNIMRCSTVPRFKYLPISAPALSTRNLHKSAMQTSDDASMRSPWKAYGSGEQSPKPDFDDSPNYGIAAPLLKSIMTQVGSKFGESTSRWGSMLSDGQVGRLKDRSAAAMSTFGDILPGPAAGLLSSLTSGAAMFDP